MLKVQREFSIHSKTYGDFSIIQDKVARKLVHLISDSPKSVLDIGCGDGRVYRSITWPLKHFVGIDFAKGMLRKHPKNDQIQLFEKDFNHTDCFDHLGICSPCRVISSSALQWAVHLDRVFEQIADLKAPVSLAIFTSGTFKTLNKTASIPDFLRSSEEVMNTAAAYVEANCEVLTYKLYFPSVREMLVYIKKSGVSGGRNVLSYSQMKNLMKNYPLGFLEFEVVLLHEETCSRK
jgi:malonyl-CoA O-methyltransferase